MAAGLYLPHFYSEVRILTSLVLCEAVVGRKISIFKINMCTNAR